MGVIRVECCLVLFAGVQMREVVFENELDRFTLDEADCFRVRSRARNGECV